MIGRRTFLKLLGLTPPAVFIDQVFVRNVTVERMDEAQGARSVYNVHTRYGFVVTDELREDMGTVATYQHCQQLTRDLKQAICDEVDQHMTRVLNGVTHSTSAHPFTDTFHVAGLGSFPKEPTQ